MGDLQPRYILKYIDSIKIYSPSLQQHVAILEYVFTLLEAETLKMSVSETRLALSEVLLIRHLVSALGIHPHPHQMEAITHMK